jgi:organic hydroperoxide reductase OsmC/OhrA
VDWSHIMAETFTCTLDWTGAAAGTVDPRTFSRDLEVAFDSGHRLPLSSAPGFRGDAARMNPEALLVAATSACQALTYLFLAARAGVRVVGYADRAEGRLDRVNDRTAMSQITLRPRIELAPDSDRAVALALVDQAHEQCFIANSLNTMISIEPTVDVKETDPVMQRPS